VGVVTRRGIQSYPFGSLATCTCNGCEASRVGGAVLAALLWWAS
jgi:hypothetical protein